MEWNCGKYLHMMEIFDVLHLKFYSFESYLVLFIKDSDKHCASSVFSCPSCCKPEPQIAVEAITPQGPPTITGAGVIYRFSRLSANFIHCLLQHLLLSCIKSVLYKTIMPSRQCTIEVHYNILQSIWFYEYDIANSVPQVQGQVQATFAHQWQKHQEDPREKEPGRTDFAGVAFKHYICLVWW